MLPAGSVNHAIDGPGPPRAMRERLGDDTADDAADDAADDDLDDLDDLDDR